MARIETVFLAGPHRFHPEREALNAERRRLCAEAGVVASGLEPRGDDDPEAGELRAREIYATVMGQLRAADAVVADLSPWRGPGADSGTAFEVGVAAALGKPVAGYINIDAEAEGELLGRVEGWVGAGPDAHDVWRDPEGARVEDLGLPETALLWAEARRLFVIVTPQPAEELAGLELCLEALKLYAD